MKRLVIYAYCLAFAALPFELPIAEGLHGVFKPFIGEGYLLFFCGTWLAILSLACLASRFVALRAGWQDFALYGILFATPGLLAILVSAFLQTGDIQLSVQQFVFGFAAPILCCFALFSLNDEEQKLAWTAFYAGWCLFLGLSLVFLVISWNAALTQTSFFPALNAGQKLFAWRYTLSEPWNIYAIYIGNANKESNYILIFLLFSARLLGEQEVARAGPRRRIYFLYWILSLFTLLILFSRAAMFLLPVVVYFSGFWRSLHRGVKWVIAGAIGGTAIVGYASYSAVFAYLFTSAYIDDVSGGALGSFNERFGQWKQIYDFLMRHTSTLIFGLGTGGYGFVFFGDVVRGTHNMFLDTLMESGLCGLFALVFLILIAFLHCFDFKALRIRRSTCLVALFVLVMLMFREHSVSFLYVTSLGGMCFAVIFYRLTSEA